MRRLLMLSLALLATVLAAVGGYRYWTGGDQAGPQVIDGVVQDESGRRVLYWHDPMVPGHRFERPGKSPFMDMMLEPMYADGADASGVKISPQLSQNLGLRLAVVEQREVRPRLDALGRIEADEERLYSVQARARGFLERLHVRSVGDPVRKGDKLAEVYAPELLAAQQEYLALRRLTDLPDSERLRRAARERLRLLGMTAAEIDAIAASGRASPRFGVYAPADGVVQSLSVREGGELVPGAPLMQIADLSRVWLIAELPERQIALVRAGQTASARLDALPGQPVTGEVVYRYPLLDPSSRTGRVRIALPNPDGALLLGMYARVTIAGEPRRALLVPTEALIVTGERQVVIVKEGEGFRPAEVEPGREYDGQTEILDGLAAGETVVASGQFLIDSEASLRGVLARLRAAEAPAEAAGAGALPRARGTVTELDAAEGYVMLDHEPIPELQWPRMTMGFKLREPAQLQGLAVGDQVAFELNPEPVGTDYLIERIERAGERP